MASAGQSSNKRHRRGSKRAKAEVFDFVAEVEEELSSGFLFEGEQFPEDDDSAEELRLFGHKDDDDDSSADDFVPLSFSFEQESVLDGRSPALYSELLGEYGWTEWEDPVSDDPASPKTDEGDSSFPSSPLSTPLSSSTATSPISSSSSQTKLRGKRQRSSSLRVTSMRWSKEELLFKITNELPSDKLEGIIMIVNPSLEFGDTDDEDLEFDINALDETTLYRLEDYVHACLADDGNDHGNESMIMERGAEIITITQTIEETVTTTSPRKRTRTKGQNTASSRSSRKTAPKSSSTPTQKKKKKAAAQAAQTLPSPVPMTTTSTTTTKKSSTRAQRRKNASPSKTTKSPAAAAAASSTRKAATTTKTTQVIETTICHFVEQDEDFNYIPHSRGDRLNTLVPEAFEVFRTEQVIKVQKSMSDSDMEEEVDII
jgi:cytoskeletal protein RodZ